MHCNRARRVSWGWSGEYGWSGSGQSLALWTRRADIWSFAGHRRPRIRPPATDRTVRIYAPHRRQGVGRLWTQRNQASSCSSNASSNSPNPSPSSPRHASSVFIATNTNIQDKYLINYNLFINLYICSFVYFRPGRSIETANYSNYRNTQNYTQKRKATRKL